jgi:hypothetical protein
MRDEVVESGLFEHEVHVTRTVWVTLELLEKLTNWTIVRNGIWYWYDGLEPEDAVVVTLHNSSSIRAVSFCVLDIIEALAVRLPDIDLYVVAWLSGSVFDGTKDQARLSIGIV